MSEHDYGPWPPVRYEFVAQPGDDVNWRARAEAAEARVERLGKLLDECEWGAEWCPGCPWCGAVEGRADHLADCPGAVERGWKREEKP